MRSSLRGIAGLNAIEVAKICFIAGLTFWLGNAAVLGIGIAAHPEAASWVDQLPPWLNRTVAIGVIIGLVAYVLWVWVQPRNVGRGPWTARRALQTAQTAQITQITQTVRAVQTAQTERAV